MSTNGKWVERPDHLFAGNHTYRIEWLNHDEWVKAGEDDGNDGVTRNAIGSIRMQLTPERPESFYQETLVHELLHVCWDNSGATHMDDGEEETLCLMLAPQVLGLLRNNEHVTKYLMSDGQVIR